MFKKLLFEAERLNGKWHPYDCFNFFTTAYYLYEEWIKKDPHSPKFASKKKSRAPKQMQDILFAFRDIAIGNKHMILNNKSLERKVVTNIHQPAIATLRSYLTNEPQVGIKVENIYYSMWDLKYIIISFFEWVFDDQIDPNDGFPKEIGNHLIRSRDLSTT